MPPEFLTKDTFEVWAAGFDQRLKDIAAVRDKVDEHGEKISVLEDRSNRESVQMTRRSMFISAGVSGLVSAVLGFFFKGSHS
ncbi:MAG TPA: hypothetical protein VEU08_04960 [Vicinamibacterales bacterium]|nr:hypothetical protein [Vicinamibacterales bacterium]